jgi:hypothetical protein
MKTLLLSLIMLMLAGCSGMAPMPELRPANRIFSHMPKDGSAEYNQGWQEGCESGMSGMTNSFYSSFYYFKQDRNMLKNEVYYKAWKDSYDYCKGYIYGIVKEADLRRSLPNKWNGDFTRDNKGILNLLDNNGTGLFRW